MDISDEVQSKYLAAADVKNSPTKTIVILDEGKKTEATDSKGQKYISSEFLVSLDALRKIWRPNKTAKKKLAEKFGSTDTLVWIGKPIVVTTAFFQGGREGIVPI